MTAPVTEVHVGATATRHGLTVWQLNTARAFLVEQRGLAARAVFHHGDCVGGDAQLAQAARELGYWIIGHPPTDTRHRAWFPSDELRAPLPYLVRNRVIVDEIAAAELGQMLACPLESIPQQRGGTWSTIRYASTHRVPLRVIGPGGNELAGVLAPPRR